jgi:hypothetical protein
LSSSPGVAQAPKGKLQKAASIRPFGYLLRARHELIGVNRPGNREQCQNRNDGQRFHRLMVVLDCGQKRQGLAHFQDKQAKNPWLPVRTRG